MPQVPQLPLHHMERAAAAVEETIHRHMILPAQGALEAPQGHVGQASPPLIMALWLMSLSVRVVSEPQRGIPVAMALPGMHD